ncbi:MAG: type I restriction enzyme HsdR N-terminal domain-containing protein [Desulfobacterales bacterium]|nr:MAG: type I restriction enzyme HsdR N-terminal domain-containing protein [Desulfobacterales bacterium]
MGGHHLILGALVDFITGETLADTHDERYRQKIARLLVNVKGYSKADIEPRRKLLVKVEDKKALVPIDFVIRLSGRIGMIIRYGPGSLVTRQRPALAASRLLAPYQIPVAVVTNGEDAEIIAASSSQVISQSLKSIPAKSELLKIVAGAQFRRIPSRQAEMEARILYAYEVDGSCPCDDTICKLG